MRWTYQNFRVIFQVNKDDCTITYSKTMKSDIYLLLSINKCVNQHIENDPFSVHLNHYEMVPRLLLRGQSYGKELKEFKNSALSLPYNPRVIYFLEIQCRCDRSFRVWSLKFPYNKRCSFIMAWNLFNLIQLSEFLRF